MQIKIVADSRNKSQLNIIRSNLGASKQAIRRALWITGLDLAGNGSNTSGTIKQAMNKGPKRGREYKYGIASAPGESPGVKTGALRKSVYKKAYGYNEIDIGVDTNYAKYLEFGSPGGQVKRRNFVIRPILNHRRKIIMNFEQELSKLGKK